MTITILLAALAAQPGAAVPTHVSARNAPADQLFTREVIVEGLEHPWAMAWLPDGTMLITERPGRLRVVQDRQLRAAPVEGVPPVLTGGQAGLLDVAVHPNFAANRLIYLTMATGTREANQTVVARARLSEDLSRLEQVEQIYSVPRAKSGAQHFGSRLLFLPDGSLLVSIGDGGNPPAALDGAPIRDQAQNLGAAFGKVIRLTDEGKPAPGNPFAGRAGALPEIYSLGHRNIQGLAWDPVRRTVWANEHGALGGDELNRIVAGANYGWPKVSRTREYVGGADVGVKSAPGMTDPVLLWEVATAPSGLAVGPANTHPEVRGDIFSGSLAANDVRRIDLDAQGRVIGETALRVGARVRDVRYGPLNSLWVLTDERNGRLIRFTPPPPPPPVR